jgi:hypothetical protein
MCGGKAATWPFEGRPRRGDIDIPEMITEMRLCRSQRELGFNLRPEPMVSVVRALEPKRSHL